MVYMCNKALCFRLIHPIAVLLLLTTFYHWYIVLATFRSEINELIESEITRKDSFISTPFASQRGKYVVLYDYVKRTRTFGYNDSVTYVTQGEFTYLDNVVNLAEGWPGPISLSVYCPGTDYHQTLLKIQYLRECFPVVKDLVTFHLFFDHEEIPKNFTRTPWKNWEQVPAEFCTSVPTLMKNVQRYRQQKKLQYPVNIARNIAREMSPTYYVLVADIELYAKPSTLIQDFLEMIRTNEELRKSSAQVFVLPIFEVDQTVANLPGNKAEMQSLLSKNLAVTFHQFLCSHCHVIPEYNKWVEAPMSSGLHVFHTAKRHSENRRRGYRRWEPIYIGTNLDPSYDERLTWEGQGDKMSQAFGMCLLDYDFHILDNAFLVHSPGIKKNTNSAPEMSREMKRHKYNTIKAISMEMRIFYGNKSECGTSLYR